MTSIKKQKQRLSFHLKFFFIAFYYAVRHPRRFWNALSAKGKKWALRALITFLIILIAVPTSLWYQAKHAKAAWWDDNWAYRQKISLTNSTGSDLTDFQVSTTVDTATLISAGKMTASTCADMRFTDSRGQQLEYWIEENNPGCDNAATKVWVKVPKVYNGTNATSIYMYYGNPSATATQSGDKTFEFFDDFSAGSLDATKWTQKNGGSPSLAGGQLTVSANSVDPAKIIATGGPTDNGYIMRTRFEATGGSNADERAGLSVKTGTSDGNGYNYVLHNFASVDERCFLDDGVVWSHSASSWAKSTWYSEEIYYDGTNVKGRFDDGSWQSQAWSGRSGYFALNIGSFDGTSVWDWAVIRKYASTDPSASASAEETGPGPVAYWRFDEGQGDTAYDSTVNGNDGTITGAIWKVESECLVGKCLSFDGSGDYVNVSDSPNVSFTGNFSTFTWIKTNSNSTQQSIIEKWGSNDFPPPAGLNGYYLRINSSGKLEAGTWTGGMSVSDVTGQTTLEENKWYFVGTIFNGSTIKVYINSKEDGSDTGVAPTDGSSDLRIGSNPAGNYSFNGSIDEVKIYPYARSASQIAQDYNAGLAGMGSATSAAIGGQSPKWMTDGLVGHWKMDESSGTTVADSSGNGNDGELINAQETGTAGTASTDQYVYDYSYPTDLSSTNDAYNGMILRITGGVGCGITTGTERTITDYVYSYNEEWPTGWRIFTVAAFSAETDNCTYEVRHQTGGKFGNGLGFAENNDYVNVGEGNNKLDGMTSISICFWANPEDGNNEGYLGKSYSFAINTGSAKDVYFRIYDSAQNLYYLSPSGGKGYVTSGSWHHYCWTADQSEMKMFKDGAFEISKSSAGFDNIQNTANNFTMGYSWVSGSDYNGNLDDVRVYNRALSPDEIKQLSEWGPGPVGWWKMDDAVSGNGQTAKDYSGNGNNGTTVDGANDTGMDCTKAGKYGGACEFDGADDRIEASDTNSNLSFAYSDFSAGAWIYPRALGYKGIIGKQVTGGYNYYWGSITGQTNLNFYMTGTGGNINVSGTAGISNYLNNWHYVYVVKTKTNVKMYVDGNLYRDVTVTDYAPYNVDTGAMSIGQVTRTGSWPWDGFIDDVRVYNYARTPKQIVEDMNAGHPIGGSPVGSPLAHWKFDEGKSNMAYDSSVNDNDGTWQGTSSHWSNGGKFGRAGYFAGGSNYVAAGTGGNVSGDRTISAWIKIDNRSTYRTIISKRRAASAISNYQLTVRIDETVQFGVNGTSSYDYVISDSSLSLDTWHYVAGVVSNDVMYLYVDGVCQSDTGVVYSGNDSDSTSNLRIGQNHDANMPFIGYIDEVKVYNSALTQDQIALDMNQGKSMQLGGQVSATGATGAAAEYCVPGDTTSCASPVGEWKFDEGSGGNANDTSGNSYTGTWSGTGTHWTVDGKYNNAGVFNGSDDEVQISAGPTLSTNATIEGWFYWKSDSDSSANLIRDNTSLSGWILAYNNGAGTVYFRAGGSAFSAGVTVASVQDRWTHYAVTKNGSDVKYYIDGQLRNIATGAGSTASALPWHIMKNGTYANFVHGNADQIQMFDYARTPAQIAWDANRGKPVGWWKLDEGEGSSVYDSSGNGVMGALTSMDPPTDWVDGKFGKALDFDGSDDYVTATADFTPLKFKRDFSIGAWVKRSSTGQHVIIAKWNAGVNQRCYELQFNSNNRLQLLVSSAGSDSTSTVDAGDQITDTNWHYVTGTYDGSNLRVYIDGTEQTGAATAFSDNLASVGAYFKIARDSDSGRVFAGQIDDVRVYNYALTQEQINQVMNEGSAIRYGD